MSLKSNFPEIIRKAQAGAVLVNAASARKVAADAGGRVPRRTGATADTIKAQHVSGDDWEATVGFPGQFIERGTARVGARPFMVPAAEAERAKHLAAVRALFR